MIRRSEHSAQKRFALVSRDLAQNRTLSFQARGLLLYVLSKPEGWKAKDTDLMREGGIKKHAYQSILNELKDAGYARRIEARSTGGKFSYSLELSEEPQLTSPEAEASPLPDYRVAAEPIADNPSTGNQVAAIDSTCAGARPLTTKLTESRETEIESVGRQRRRPAPYPKRTSWPRYISLFFAVTNSPPMQQLWPEIERMMGANPEPGRLRKCYVEWLKRGYRKEAIGWLEWYEHNDIPPQRGDNGRRNQTQSYAVNQSGLNSDNGAPRKKLFKERPHD